MDSDYLEGRGRDVEVCEPGVLQVVEVALSQSVPAGVNNIRVQFKSYKILHPMLRTLLIHCKIVKLIFAQEANSQWEICDLKPIRATLDSAFSPME